MMGETANIQASKLPYAHLIILRQPTPYFKRNKTSGKLYLSHWETLNDLNIKKYSELIFENPQAHRPIAMAVPILEINEHTMKISFSKLENHFSEHNVSILNGKLSLENLFKEVSEYKNYYLSKNN